MSYVGLQYRSREQLATLTQISDSWINRNRWLFKISVTFKYVIFTFKIQPNSLLEQLDIAENDPAYERLEQNEESRSSTHSYNS